MKISLSIIISLFFFLSCHKETMVKPCPISPLDGSTWEMTSVGVQAHNELNLSPNFEMNITPTLTPNEYLFDIDGHTQVLELQQDTINAPNWYLFVGGTWKLMHIAFEIDVNNKMDLWFSSQSTDTLGTNNFKMVNSDCIYPMK